MKHHANRRTGGLSALMSRFLSFTATAGLCMGALLGCNDVQRDWVLNDVSVSLPAITGKERPGRRAGAPAEWLDVQAGGGQCVLMSCWTHDNPQVNDDESCRAFVIVLDGPPAKGTIEVTPENGRFIEYTAWLPPRRPYAGAEGRIKILGVTKSGEVYADCAVRNVIARSGDPVWPMRGVYCFKPAGGVEKLGPVRVAASQPE